MLEVPMRTRCDTGIEAANGQINLAVWKRIRSHLILKSERSGGGYRRSGAAKAGERGTVGESEEEEKQGNRRAVIG